MQELETKHDLLEAFKVYSNFSKTLLDAFVLIDTTGKVIHANPLFGHLVNRTTKQILKSDHIDQLIRFHLGKTPLTVKNMLVYDHHTRMDEVRGEIHNEASKASRVINLILGIFPFIQDGEHLGIFLLMRDVTAESTLQDKYKTKTSQSITDPLTGLYNRLFFENHLPNIIEQMIGEGEDYAMSILMVDVDHFKIINDTHGHQCGDIVLQSIGKKIKELCRKSDITCRYGGEEFLVVLPGTDLHGSKIVAEKLRKTIEALEIPFQNKTIKVTVSVGSSQINVGMEKAEQAIGRADRALYQAKETGRNKVCVNHNGKIT